MRLVLTVSVKATLRPGAVMRARNARPYGLRTQCLARRGRGPEWRAEVVAPYEIARQFTFSRPTGQEQ